LADTIRLPNRPQVPLNDTIEMKTSLCLDGWNSNSIAGTTKTEKDVPSTRYDLKVPEKFTSRTPRVGPHERAEMIRSQNIQSQPHTRKDCPFTFDLKKSPSSRLTTCTSPSAKRGVARGNRRGTRSDLEDSQLALRLCGRISSTVVWRDGLMLRLLGCSS
jgi:hypothetical protein